MDEEAKKGRPGAAFLRHLAEAMISGSYSVKSYCAIRRK